MKHVSRKLLAGLLAALMVISAMPMTVLANEDLTALQQAMQEYETKMDGTVYENMAAAYTAYANAAQAAYAYRYGGRTDLPLRTLANTLTAATAAMTAWTPYTASAQASFKDDTEDVANDYAYNTQNLLYTEAKSNNRAAYSKADQVNQNSVKTYVEMEIYYPQTVMLYDGETAPIMPVLGRAKTSAKGALPATRSVYAVYPCAGKESLENSALFGMNNTYWLGVAGRFDRDVNWPWTMQQPEMPNGKIATQQVFGSPQDIGLECSKSGGIGALKFNAFANAITYRGGDTPFAESDNEFCLTQFLEWKRFTGESGPEDYLNMTADTTPIYVINYKALRTAAAAATQATAENVQASLKNCADYTALLTAVNTATDFDPNEPFKVNASVQDNVALCTNTLQTRVEAIRNAQISTPSMADYALLSTTLETAQAIYEDNNATGQYTAASFAQFAAAYEAARAAAAAVVDDGFVATTAGDDLQTAIKALNRVIAASGTSGDTTYTFDETMGAVTVHGPGEMADYESGAESPFGENDTVTTVTVENTVTHIGENAFENASDLTTITVPANATYGAGAFDGCTKLKTVIITGGEVKNAVVPNAPWLQPSVRVIKLGTGESDLSVTAVDDQVFSQCAQTAVYIYNDACVIPDESALTFGSQPTIYGWVPSTAQSFAAKFGYLFVSLGHKHDFDYYEGEVVAPTCTAAGFTRKRCQYCDNEQITNRISALGHDYQETATIAPTCVQRGYTESTCSRCGNIKHSNETEVLEHMFENAAPLYAVNMVRDAQTSYRHALTCSRCLSVAVEEYCSFEITDTITQGEQKFIVFTCCDCQGTYYYPTQAETNEHMVFYLGTENQLLDTENVKDKEKPTSVPTVPVAPEGHTYVWLYNGSEVNPSEIKILDNTVFSLQDKENLFEVSYYDSDNALISTEKVPYGNQPAAVPELPEPANRADEGHYIYQWDVIPASAVITEPCAFRQVAVQQAHQFTDKVLKAPTCTENGVRSRHCTVCGYLIENETMAKTNHISETDKAVPATCTADGKTEGAHCAVCKTVLVAQTTVPMLAHQWDAGVVTEAPALNKTGSRRFTCTVCQTAKTEVIAAMTLQDITPSVAVADSAPVNKTIQKPMGISTVSRINKKQMEISFNPVAGAQNYRVMYRKAGAKKWNYAWTDGKTTYTLKKLKNKGLYEFAFAVYKKDAQGNWERGAYSKTSYRYYYKATLKKAAPNKQSVKVTWNKDKSATGYEVYYAANSNMKGAKKVVIKSNKKTACTLNKLKRKKTYYIRVRALKKSKGKTYVGEYSAKKKVKIK